MGPRKGILTIVAVSALFASSALADEEVDWEHLPPKVRATIEREAAGGSVEETLDLTDEGQLFRVTIEKNDEERVMYIDANGRVVGRVLE